MIRKLRPGQLVFTFNGEQLGSVARVLPDRFHVRGKDGGQWLRSDALLDVDRHSVRLICNRSRLDAYVLPVPPAERDSDEKA